jgi:hypothetical protein
MPRSALALVLVLAGCAQTKVESTWKNPALPDRKIKVFAVFGVTGSPSGRIQFEEALTKGLTDRGLDAKPGYDFVLYDERPSKEEVISRLKAKNIEGVLVSKIARRTTKTESTPVYVGGGYGTYYGGGFYDYWYAPMAMSSYTTETNEFIVETVLYALTDDVPMWATRTNTRRTDAGAFANDIGGSVAAGLKTAGIVPQ